MLSLIPVLLDKVQGKELDNEILRAAIVAEFDAINLYMQMAAMTQNEDLKKILFEVAREEKTHVGEFQALLLLNDAEHMHELEKGKLEVSELIGK
ncbi:MAG: ferritin family protein [Syntrophorhabdus sp.]